MDDHCKLDKGEVFQDYYCLLNFVDEKSDKFYRIQVLKNDKGFHVWTRWGRNTLQKPELKDAFLSKVQLPVDVLYVILSQLPVRDVLRYMQVCKDWKTLLSDKYFWKMYIQKHFDLGIKSDLSNEGPMALWSGVAWTEFGEVDSFRDDMWFCSFNDEDGKRDVYVMRPFPSMWNCRVFHPYGLDPFSGDVRSLQGFCRSLEILTYMRSEASRLDMHSGYQCSENEVEDEICAVIFPWDKKDLPTPLELLNGVFHFHPEIYEDYISDPEDKGELRENKLYFHGLEDTEYSDDNSDYDDWNAHADHDLEEKPCLNRIFGMGFPNQDEQKDCRKFYEWLQPIMYPSVTVYAGGDKVNPVAVFMLTQLAPGWAGGALTAVSWP